MVATRSRRPPGPSSATAHRPPGPSSATAYRPKIRKRSEKETRDWSVLPDDLLYEISNSLAFEVDAVRFRSVCSSWRSAALKRRLSPWLVGCRKNIRGKLTLYSFFSLSGVEIRPIDSLPETRLGKTCCGSSHGWLALVGENRQIILYNPITRSRIPLPEINSDFVATFQIGSRWDVLLKVLLSSDPMVAKDCTVVLLRREGVSLAFCRPGDDAWTLAPIPRLGVFGNLSTGALLYKGQLYIAVPYHPFRCKLLRCKLGPNPEVVEILVAGGLDPLEKPGPQNLYPRVQTFLVESCGDLLMVSHWSGINGISSDEIHVYNIEFNDTLYLAKRMESLGDRVIFIGQNQSLSVPASKLPECKANCIYMAGYAHYLYPRQKMVAMFNLENGDKQLIPFLSPDAWPVWEPSAWIMPNIS